MGKNNRYSTVSMILIAVLVLTAIFNVAYTGAFRASAGSADIPVADAKGSIRKSDVNMDAVREQYLNYQTVEKNTASYDGTRWVIVELEGQTLYEAFRKSTRYSDFSEFLKSVEAQKALASLRAKQGRFFDRLQKYQVNYNYKYSYSTLSTGVAIEISAEDYNVIKGIDGVKDIYYSERYAMPKYDAVENQANVYTTGIYNTMNLINVDTDGDGTPDGTYQGQGMAVAILDTGLDSTHEAFDPTVYEQDLEEAGALDSVHYDRDAIQTLLGGNDLNAQKFGSGINDVYYNLKVPFAYDYADDDPNVFPSYNSHGTHVAGIVAGKSDYVVNDQGTPADTDDDEKFRGVAPLAQLVICKVFTDDLYDNTIGGADQVDLLAALEDCVKLGVDVINMSLGSSCGFADEKTDAYTNQVYDSIRSAGISLVCAASNDYSSGYGGGNGTNLASNPDSSTVGSPSTYYSALSVASINGQLSKYVQGNGDGSQVAFITNSSDGNGNRIEFVEAVHEYLESKYGQAAADAGANLRGGDIYTKGLHDDLVLKYVLIDGVGKNTNYRNAERNQLNSRTAIINGKLEKVDGTIALVKRGETTFEEKVREAMTAGADAVIIYNNVSGTVNMSLGELDDPVPTCLITMDASIPFVNAARSNNSVGYLEISDDFQAGPFMSDFSSWGPVSDLTLKPEITAHGGEITSAVAGAYDIYSGTSMASPNMAGAVALLRQYVKANERKYNKSGSALDANQINALANQLLMSTATIANNEFGNPYSPRKQGAGLANIYNAVTSESYITVRANEKIYNNEHSEDCIVEMNGERWLDKTKLELLDDPGRTGEYHLTFTVHNVSTSPQIYSPTTYVMTETLASDRKTVAERSYSLAEMSTITYAVGAQTFTQTEGGTITVPAGQMVEVNVTIKLGAQAIAYLEQEVTRQRTQNGQTYTYIEKPFANGMYVEGFVSLDNVTNGTSSEETVKDGVTIGLPYLAFYGDWADAPLFDYDVYEVSEDEKDKSIDLEDKIRASAAATQVIGTYHNEDYILPLGTYLYETKETDDEIYPERDKIALSMYDEEGNYTTYELYAIYAGLLRNASYMNVVFTDAVTGEVAYEEKLENVSKSYAAGGSNRGAFVRMEINPQEWGWKNNDSFIVTLDGFIDYQNEEGEYVQSNAEFKGRDQYYAQCIDPKDVGTGTKRNTFEFPLTIDYEAPQILDYSIRFDPYEEYGQTKYKVFLDLEVYDNQYAMSVLPCFRQEHTEGELGTFLTLLTEYPVPVYGNKGQSTMVAVDITDYYEQYGLEGELYIQVEDYAMNAEVYNITLDDESLDYPSDQIVLIEDSKLKNTGRTGKNSINEDKSEYPIYSLTISPFELYKLNVDDTSVFKNLSWQGESEFAIVNEGEVFGLKNCGGESATFRLYGTMYNYDLHREVQKIFLQLEVKVEGFASNRLITPTSLSFKPIHAGDSHVVNPDTSNSVEVNPNTTVTLVPYITPWYFEAAYEVKNGKPFEFEWLTRNSRVAEIKHDEDTPKREKKNNQGQVTETWYTLSEADIQLIVKGSANIECQSKDPAYPSLRKAINMQVGEDYNVINLTLYDYYGDSVADFPSEYPDVNVLYLDENCFKNDQSITEVVLPAMLQEIPEGAFENCVNLRKITINSQCTTIGIGAFRGCTSLKEVAFAEYLDANKDPVKDPVTGKDYFGSITVGHYAFDGCVALDTFTRGERMTVMYDYAFRNCDALTTIDLSTLRIVGSHVFDSCDNLETVILTKDTAVGEHMFENCTKLANIKYKNGDSIQAGYPVNKLPESVFEGCEMLSNITFVGEGFLGIGARALAHTIIEGITLPKGEYEIDSYAFAYCENLKTVTLQDGTTITHSGADPYIGCTHFTAYSAEGNDAYLVKEGALYSADETTLYSVPTGIESYTLPAEVKHIADGALSGSNITTIDISAIESVGKYAFAYSKLKTVTLKSGMDIPEGLFEGCDQLTIVNNLDTVNNIGARAFMWCSALQEANISQATSVGDYAFYGIAVEDDAMNGSNSALATLTAPLLQKVGYGAFEGTRIVELNLPAVTDLGAWAFAFMEDLTSVTIGPVEEMGGYVFYGSNKIASVTFVYGAKVIGSGAFSTYNPYLDSYTELDREALEESDELYKLYVWQDAVDIKPSTALKSVTIPGTVQSIGAYAFAGQAGLAEIDLANVTNIGSGAFRQCTALKTADLSKVEEIGDNAFRGTAFTAVDLSNAKIIGAYAFAGGEYSMSQWTAYYNDEDEYSNFTRTREIKGGAIATLTLGKAERIGDFAFAGNNIKTVTIPKTLNKRTYTFTEQIFDKKGNVERERERKGETFGAGVFAYNKSLTRIYVEAGNDLFTSIDGALYVKVVGGLILKQYPGAGTGLKYTVADGTVAIGDSAFEGAKTVTEVEFPYTVKAIGSAAFFSSSVEKYVFNSVQAPTLIASYDPFVVELCAGFFSILYHNSVQDDGLYHYPWDIIPEGEEDAGEMYLDPTLIATTAYYGNFNGYVFMNGYGNIFWSLAGTSLQENITFNVPKNGRGYDTAIWDMYAKNIEYSAETLPDDNVHATWDAIEALESKYTIAQISALAQANDKAALEINGELSKAIQAARQAYNAIVGDDQKALAAEQYQTLLTYEKALRDARKQVGITVTLTSVQIETLPKSYYKDGERFSIDGMTLKVVYSDGSELLISGDEVKNTVTYSADVLHLGQSQVEAQYKDAYTGMTTTFMIDVDVQENTDGGSEGNGGGVNAGGNLPGWAIALIVIGAVAAVGAAAAATIIVLKKKKSAKPEGDGNNGGEKAGEQAETPATEQAETPANEQMEAPANEQTEAPATEQAENVDAQTQTAKEDALAEQESLVEETADLKEEATAEIPAEEAEVIAEEPVEQAEAVQEDKAEAEDKLEDVEGEKAEPAGEDNVPASEGNASAGEEAEAGKAEEEVKASEGSEGAEEKKSEGAKRGRKKKA